MTVRIEKPAFNLREKLSELEFSTLPYHKIPPGSIVQSKVKYSNNTTFSTTATDWTSLGPIAGQVDFTIKMTPKFLGSKILFETNFTAQLNDEDGYARYRLVDLNNPGGTTTLHANTYCAASHYLIEDTGGITGYPWINVPVRTFGTVTHMNEHNFVLQVKVNSGGTLSFSWSGSDYRVVQATEIRQ